MEYTNNNPLRVFTAFSGYDSQCMALERLKENFPEFGYTLVGWSEIEPNAIRAHNLVFPQYSECNYGDISKIDWSETIPDFDLLTYSFPCLAGDTLIKMHDDSMVKIADIKPDDYVLTPEGPKKVTKTYIRGPKNVKRYTIQTDRGNVTLVATPDHRVKTYTSISLGSIKWIEIDKLTSKLNVSANYGNAVVLSITKSDVFTEDVYDISVEDCHEFYANGLLVHNCTDISVAGQQKGLQENSGTRSALLWECRRAIEAKKPKYLLMENVKALVSDKFKPEFAKWTGWLEEQGYANYWEVLNAKDYGVPQNRERVFMVSILKEDGQATPYYEFPGPFPLERRLKDVLEDDVPESYYLKSEQVDRIIAHCERKAAEGCGFRTNFRTEDEISGTFKTKEGAREYDTYLKEPHEVAIDFESYESRHIELNFTHKSSDYCDHYDAKFKGCIGDLLKSLPSKNKYSGYDREYSIEVKTVLGWVKISYKNGNATTDFTRADLAPLPIAENLRISGTYDSYSLEAKLNEEGNRILSEGSLNPISCALRGRGEGWKQQIEIKKSADVANCLTTRTTDSMVATPSISVNPISHPQEFDGYKSFKDKDSPTLRATDCKNPPVVVENPKIEIVGHCKEERDNPSFPAPSRSRVYHENGMIGTQTATDYKEPKTVLTSKNNESEKKE